MNKTEAACLLSALDMEPGESLHKQKGEECSCRYAATDSVPLQR